jgi:uncharacterized protein (DUF2237 family)
MPDRNVLGGPLEPCVTDPLAGFYRDGCCSTGPEDLGGHTICAVVTAEFLEHRRPIGNDLSTPVLEYRFSRPRARRPLVRHRRELAPGLTRRRGAPVVLASTEERTLDDQATYKDDLQRPLVARLVL